MKRIPFIILLFFITSVGQAQGLKKTIKEFTKVLTGAKTTQIQFTISLKPYLDPSANVDSLCADYYDHWRHNAELNSYPIETRIEKISKQTDNATAMISNIWQLGEDGKFYFLSKTTWVYKNGRWYRSGHPAEIIERRKI